MNTLARREPALGREDSRRIDRIFLLHLWACVPFAPLWLLHTESQPDPQGAIAMRWIAGICAVYLILRTWVVFGNRDPERWSLAWPVLDVALITAILVGIGSAEDPTAFLYLLAITYATLKLPFGQAVGIVALAILGQLVAGAVTETWTPYVADGKAMYVLFRHFFLLLLASLVLLLSRETQRWRARVALAEYQTELASEMHDGIQHELVVAARSLDLASALSTTAPERAVAIAVEQRETLRRASDELRFMIRQLRRGPEPGAGFLDELERYLEMLAGRNDLSIQLERQGEFDHFPAAYQHTVLRIVQEAITNTVKHAGANSIRVRVSCARKQYVLQVEDDGAGFDRRTPEGFGVESIRRRAMLLGGTARVVSRPGCGTRVVVRLPETPPAVKGESHGANPRGAG